MITAEEARYITFNKDTIYKSNLLTEQILDSCCDAIKRLCIGGGCLTAMLFSWWTDRTVDFWCSYYFGHNVDIPFIWSFY